MDKLIGFIQWCRSDLTENFKESKLIPATARHNGCSTDLTGFKSILLEGLQYIYFKQRFLSVPVETKKRSSSSIKKQRHDQIWLSFLTNFVVFLTNFVVFNYIYRFSHYVNQNNVLGITWFNYYIVHGIKHYCICSGYHKIKLV